MSRLGLSMRLGSPIQNYKRKVSQLTPNPPVGYTQIFDELSLPIAVGSAYQVAVRHYDEPDEVSGGQNYQLLQLSLGGDVEQSLVEYPFEFYYDNPNFYLFASDGSEVTFETDESYSDWYTALQGYLAENSGISPDPAPTDVGIVTIAIHDTIVVGGLPQVILDFQDIVQKLTSGNIQWVSVWGEGGFEP